MHDFKIENATIVDGTGSKPFTGSLAVADGKIAAIGADVGPARETIDGSGLVLAPGIIDGHTHYDAQITWDAMVDPSPSLGVTTVVLGTCGFTIAPCRPEDRDITMRNLTQVEGMSLEALRNGIKWDFESFPQYLDMLEKRGVGLNVACFVGHSSVRTFVLREDASRREATDAEIAQMARIVREALEAGAIGFSSTTNESHNGEGGIPMPSRLADDREMHGIMAALKQAGRGIYMTTKGAVTPIAKIEEYVAVSERPALISGFLYNKMNPDRAKNFLTEIADARARGRTMHGEVSCCPLTMDFTLKSAYILEGYAAWKPAMEVEGKALRKLYADPVFRDSVKADLEKYRGHRAFNSEWDKVQVVEAAKAENAKLEGKTIAELAQAMSVHPLDCLLDLALSEDLDTVFTATLLNSDDEEVAKIITDPETYITLSDAGAHLTFLCDAGFGLHLLGYWTRDLGKFSLEQAIYRLTGHPAALFGISDRGHLKAGLAADLLLFDPATVARGGKQRRRDLPGGGARLVTPGHGVRGVWVNGQRVVGDSGAPVSGVTPGRVLREFRA